jgi:hypothetical protein
MKKILKVVSIILVFLPLQSALAGGGDYSAGGRLPTLPITNDRPSCELNKDEIQKFLKASSSLFLTHARSPLASYNIGVANRDADFKYMLSSSLFGYFVTMNFKSTSGTNIAIRYQCTDFDSGKKPSKCIQRNITKDGKYQGCNYYLTIGALNFADVYNLDSGVKITGTLYNSFSPMPSNNVVVCNKAGAGQPLNCYND